MSRYLIINRAFMENLSPGARVPLAGHSKCRRNDREKSRLIKLGRRTFSPAACTAPPVPYPLPKRGRALASALLTLPETSARLSVALIFGKPKPSAFAAT